MTRSGPYFRLTEKVIENLRRLRLQEGDVFIRVNADGRPEFLRNGVEVLVEHDAVTVMRPGMVQRVMDDEVDPWPPEAA